MIRKLPALCLLSLIVSQFSGCMGVMGGAGGCGGGGYLPFNECVGDVDPNCGGCGHGPRPSLFGRLAAGGCGCRQNKGCRGGGVCGPMYGGAAFGGPMMTADAGCNQCETCGDGGVIGGFDYGDGGMVYDGNVMDGNMMPMQSGMGGGCASCQQQNIPMQPIPHQMEHHGNYSGQHSGQHHGMPNAPLPPVNQQIVPTPAQPMGPHDSNSQGEYFAPPITSPGPTTMMPQGYLQPQMMGQPMMNQQMMSQQVMSSPMPYSGMTQYGMTQHGMGQNGMMAPQMEMAPQMMQPQMMPQQTMSQPAVQQTYYAPPAVQAF